MEETPLITLSAPAKLNLYLGVGDAMPDGYHAVTTVLQALELSDEVRIASGEGLILRCEPDLGIPAEENLALRAALAFADALGRDPDVSIEIRKEIPAGAGLGGGSSDAAAVIRGLSELWGVPSDDPARSGVARSLGADVPFFLHGGAALMSGRGDELVRRVAAPVMDAVVVWPGVPVSTADAYRAFDRMRPAAASGPEELIEALEAGDGRAAAGAVHNDMTAASSTLVPEIGEVLAFLRDAPGVLGSEMCGSGSAVFGVCETSTAAAEVASAARERGWWAAATRTVASSSSTETVSEGRAEQGGTR